MENLEREVTTTIIGANNSHVAIVDNLPGFGAILTEQQLRHIAEQLQATANTLHQVNKS